jgi:Flp pilus assembly protein TadG
MNRKQSCRGQMLVMFALMMPIFVAFAGLAVDVSYAFMLKSALVTATDSAALAGSRAIPSLNTDSLAVSRAVDRTFKANLQANILPTGVPTYTAPTVTIEGNGSRSISIVGTAQSPTYFLRLFGINSFTVRAYAKGVRRDVNVMLVLDRSGSLIPAWSAVRDGAVFFVDQFDDARDKLGLVTFGTSGNIEYVPQTGFQTPVRNMINGMPAPNASNHTNSSLGLYLGYQALKNMAANNSENVIVYFTDGVATAFPGQFDVNTSGKPHCDSTPKDGIFSSQNNGASVLGLFRRDQPLPRTWPSPDYVAFPDCYNSSGSNNGNHYGQDLLSGGFRATWQPPAGPAIPLTGINPVNLNNPHQGRNIVDIGENMLINVAAAARSDALNMRIFVIALGGSEPPNEDVLKRVANVEPYTVSGQPVGLEIFAPTQSQLMEAFREVASSISRLDK